MRIVFIGAVDFSLHTLRCVLAEGGEVAGVVTLPLERAHVHADFADLGPVCAEHGIPLLRFASTRSPEAVAAIGALQPDVIFVFGWSQLVPAELIAIAPMGAIGTHPALLPRNRGRHPLIWALVEGLSESGLTFFYLDEGADSGDVLWQRPFPITLEDDAASLYAKMKALACEGIAEFLPALAAGTALRLPQDDALATYWRKRSKQDGLIHWDSPSMTTYNLVRALTRPYPGAHTNLGGEEVTVWRALPPTGGTTADPGGTPGMVLASEAGTLTVRTGDGTLVVTEYTTPTGMPIAAGSMLGGEA